MTRAPRVKPRRFAIVGAGPSGFYAAEALLRAGLGISVDMYEKLPVPFGLVRYGVAPDHPKLKQVTAVFTRIARMPGFRFFGNVNIGRDVAVETLARHYNGVIFASGAEREKDLGIPGEDLPGSYSAREFVAWYNGHPEYRDLSVNLDHETAVVIGQGNVALDVARILIKTPDELQSTDIAVHALAALRASRVKTVHIVGRRSPAQARFTVKELRAFSEFTHCDTHIDPDELQLGRICEEEVADPRNTGAQANIEILQSFAAAPAGRGRTCRFRFLKSPVSFNGSDCVESVTFERTILKGEAFRQKCEGTGITETIPCGLVVRCIGYRAQKIGGVPLDNGAGILTNEAGRLIDKGIPLPGFYATGWAKRGPSGTIGTNRGDSVATVETVLEDLDQLPDTRADSDELIHILQRCGHQLVRFGDWERIDALEQSLGSELGKPRRKLTRVSHMLEAARPVPI